MASADILRAAHTELPWRVDPSYTNDIQGPGGVEIATLFDHLDVGEDLTIAGPCPSPEAGIANAAFIVRACNAHYQMLEALKVAQASLAMLTEPAHVRTSTVHQAWGQAVEAELKVRLAIAAAEAEAGR